MDIKKALKIQKQWLKEAKKRNDYKAQAQLMIIIERNELLLKR